jgi:hypothetical protein
MKFTKKHLIKFSILLVFVLLVSACKKERIHIDVTPPPMVTELIASPQDGFVILSWTEPISTDLVGIEITYTPGSSMVYSQSAGLNGATISGLLNGTAYDFSVKTVDEVGNKSDAVTVTATPNPPFVVVSPDQSDYNPAGGTFSSDGNGHLIISVTFNRPVDINSVVPAATIYFEGDAISEGTVIFSNGNKTITFTTTDEVADFATMGGNAVFDFLLIGTDDGNGVVMDSNGMVLDGDEDGLAGGNYELNLYIIG